MLLSIAYFPPISYFALIAKYPTVYIEACENYQKQSWRNRFRFYAADGPQYLNFPVVHEGGTHELPIREIKVDYSTPWVVRTERAIASAYESSAFFEYYKDELFSILDSKPETLFELDLQIIRFFLRKTGITANLLFTDEYVGPADISTGPVLPTSWAPSLFGSQCRPVEMSSGTTRQTTDAPSLFGSQCRPVEMSSRNCNYGVDYREVLHPKRLDTVLRDLGLERPYFQVFAAKYGFVPGLSIMDLLFNEGPDSIFFLKSQN